MEPFAENATVGEIYGPAMEVTDPQEANAYFARIVSHLMRYGNPQEFAETTARRNLGYYSGYYGIEVQQRVERLYGAVHPIFGPTSGPQLTTQEVFDLGVKMGEEMRRKAEEDASDAHPS